ncbi:MAG TPA: indolepyruvate ferredoxin oxidoreductase family protein [Acidimicrobiales bacterium]|nr:indolepyruvate ferredoxin oxidoreductase family protein [Acidimicrobiales bacterium]
MTGVEVRTPQLTTVSGIEALVRLLVLRHELDLRDGLRTGTLVSGYPGSPLGGFDLAVERAGELLAAHAVEHRPGLNEELAAATVWGSQMGAAVPYAEVDGVAGVWYGKTPGLDRSGDVLKHGNAMGAGPNGGVVLVCGDDPTAKSSTLPSDSQYTFLDACIPVVFPCDQQDVLDLGLHAFRLSRYAGCWVGMKIVTTVADGIGSVCLELDRQAPRDPEDVLVRGRRWVHEPLATIGPHAVPDQELLVVHDRLAAARAYVRSNGLDRVIGAEGHAPVGIVCAGKTYMDVVSALSDYGVRLDQLADVGVRILKLAVTYPVGEETLLEFASSVDELVVIEEKRPFVETQVRAVLHEARSHVPVSGKRYRAGDPLTSEVGELDAAALSVVLGRVIPALVAPVTLPAGGGRPALAMTALPSRPPAFCSGCPHNRSTLFPEAALVGGGVGCHGIMYFEERHRGMKSLAPTPMGAEGVPWIGLAPFVGEPHLIQNMGDGTLSHSGSLAIRASVAAGVNVTFKLLYNAAVAMTGGQEVTGLLDVPALTRSLHAEGVRTIVVCAEDPDHYGRRARWAPGVEVVERDRLPEIQERLRQVRGVSVIVYDQRCAAEARRLRKAGLLAEPPQRVFINEAVCEGCGDCSTKSNCLSVLPVATEFGEKRRIHESSCNRDYTCLEGDCPSFVTLRERRRGRRSARARSDERPALPGGMLPLPATPSIEGAFGLYFTGVGGTGVVTANRVVASAAEASGLAVAGMDQTGLSQKAGAVVSHLHLASDRRRLAAATIGPAGADLYLSGDILQAAAGRHLDKLQPGRSLAVIDDGVTPTAAMLQTDSEGPDRAALRAAVTDRAGLDRVVFVDSKRIAESVFGNHLLANIVLLGAAFQAGGLPLSLDALHGAVQRLGKTAPDNWQAFQWGRWVVHDASSVEACLRATEAGRQGTGSDLLDPSARALAHAGTMLDARRLPDELRPLLLRRAAQVIDYQHARLAARFLDLVEEVASTDSGRGWALTAAVTEAWFKLLTYKDEYEVARLHLEVDFDHVAHELGIEGPYTVTYHLHPPVLRRLGLKRKLPMGRPYRAAFHVLRRMRRLRGTPFDPFGWDRDRRTERALLVEYRRLVHDLVRAGSRSSEEVTSYEDASYEDWSYEDASYEDKVELARSVLEVKGYGPVKEAAVRRWREHVAVLNRAGSVTTA